MPGGVSCGQVLRPVSRDPALRFSKVHPPSLNLRRQIVLDRVLLLEISLVQRGAIRAALRPDIVERVGAAKLQRDEVIEFTGLRLARVVGWVFDPVPVIGMGLLGRRAG